jgi:hypothetical protein
VPRRCSVSLPRPSYGGHRRAARPLENTLSIPANLAKLACFSHPIPLRGQFALSVRLGRTVLANG